MNRWMHFIRLMLVSIMAVAVATGAGAKEFYRGKLLEIISFQRVLGAVGIFECRSDIGYLKVGGG